MHQLEYKDIWVKAAVVGSLWASVEIIMGSFFHNLQLPFAGTLLAVFSVIFVISVYQIWPIAGLIWRAGLISALMKSISPSAVILGPMTGIFLEAVLLEVFVFLLGKNLLSYTIASIMAVLSTLIHKLLTLLMIYGWDAVKLLSNVYTFAMKQLNFVDVSPIHAIWVLISVYILLGMLSAVVGYIIGKNAITQKDKTNQIEILNLSTAESFFTIAKHQKFSLYLLLSNIVVVVVILLIINQFSLFYGFLSVFIYLIFNIIRYKDALRRFKSPALWMQLIILTILASLFYFEGGHIAYFSLNGFLMGLEMTLRAITVIMGFSAISVELRNPLIKAVLNRHGFSNLYNALGMAFSALPAIMSDVTKPSKMFKKPFKTIIDILLYTNTLYLAFIKSNKE